MSGEDGFVWYAAYGSNTHRARLRTYLVRCRETDEPRQSRALELGGAVYFATESPVWGGGRGFYDPEAGGKVLARAHLVTAGQFSDILALEMYREPGTDLDLSEAVTSGRAELGPGRYETVVCPGRIDGVPLVALTAPWAVDEVELREPAEAYVRHIAAGLRESGAWAAEEIADYVAACPGAAGRWTAEAVLALMPEAERKDGEGDAPDSHTFG
ncbi:histone deacetylase [Streptomyces sp. NPDC053493]|uniref:histone deacetylase n=1 Tax=Streptomyces sp. NPDC053493 TaxID=3365705 RepID=UPI0037CDF199